MSLIKIDDKLYINEQQKEEIVSILRPSEYTLIHLKGGQILMTKTPLNEVIDLIYNDHLIGAL